MTLYEELWQLSKTCPIEYESILIRASAEIQRLTEENKKLKADVSWNNLEKKWSGQ
jgi:hypothetical protein